MYQSNRTHTQRERVKNVGLAHVKNFEELLRWRRLHQVDDQHDDNVATLMRMPCVLAGRR